MTDAPEAPISGRSRARRNVIGKSPHREEYERLLEGGWSSLALERYAAFRFGEDIPASTFRAYRLRAKMQERLKNQKAKVEWARVEPDRMVDVLEMRAQLIALQRERISVDWQHEQSMSKLFGSTKGEIQVLNALLDSHKADLQDVGVMPKAGEKIEITNPRASAEAGAPRAQTLGDLVGALDPSDPESEMVLARVVHMATKKAAANGNGQAKHA